MPHPFLIFAFLGGAIVGYLILAFISERYLDAVTPVRMRRLTLMNVIAIFPALAVSILVQFVPWPIVGFFVAGFVSTLTYMLGLAAFLWLMAWGVTRRHV